MVDDIGNPPDGFANRKMPDLGALAKQPVGPKQRDQLGAAMATSKGGNAERNNGIIFDGPGADAVLRTASAKTRGRLGTSEHKHRVLARPPRHCSENSPMGHIPKLLLGEVWVGEAEVKVMAGCGDEISGGMPPEDWTPPRATTMTQPQSLLRTGPQKG